MLDRPRAVLRRVIQQVSRSDNRIVRRGYAGLRDTARRTVNTVTSRQLGWVATLWAARWVESDVLELRGWAYERGHGFPDGPPEIQVWLERAGRRIDATVEPLIEPEVNARASRSADFDYSNTAFRARIDAAAVRGADEGGPWVVRIQVTGDGRSRQRNLHEPVRARVGWAPVRPHGRRHPGRAQLDAARVGDPLRHVRRRWRPTSRSTVGRCGW